MRDPKGDLISFLREILDVSELDYPIDKGDPNNPNAPGDIAFPDYDGGLDYPGIYPASKDSTVVNGGDLDVSGLNLEDQQVMQDTLVSIQLDCWGGTQEDDFVQDHEIHPGTIATELAELVHNTINNHTREMEDYDNVVALPPSESHDTQPNSTVYREIVLVRLGYTE